MGLRRWLLASSVLWIACHAPEQSVGLACARASECPTPLVCGFGACRAECTASGECATGVCLITPSGDGACSLVTEQGCGTTGAACPTGLVCHADRCERTCTNSIDCPTEATCTPSGTGVSFCVDTSATGDAGDVGVTDGDVQDGGASDAAVDGEVLDGGGTTPRTVVAGCIGTTAACVIATDGDVYCWGSAANGALGDGGDCTTATHRSVPARVPGVFRADVIACGDGFVCAHQMDGHTLCWGRNDLGQLGRDTSGTCDATPAPVLAATDAPLIASSADLAAAGAHACVLALPSGALWCWGRNDGLVDVTMGADAGHVYARATDALQPLRDAPGTPLPAASVTGIAVSATGASARITGRDLYLWGANEHLQTASTAGPAYAARLSTGAGRGASAVAGRLHRCALESVGAVCWGANTLAQLGHAPGAAACGADPCEPPGVGMGTFVSLAASGDGDATCGITTSGAAVRCWGDDAHGLAGVTGVTATLEGTAPVTLPSAVRTPLLRAIVGPTAACVIDGGSALWCWGDHDLDASTADLTTPVRVTPGA